jgi:hypothetical protein
LHAMQKPMEKFLAAVLDEVPATLILFIGLIE